MRKVVMFTIWFLAAYPFGIGPTLGQTHINADDTIHATNYGYHIHFGWAKLPEGTTKIVLARASKQTGPWLTVLVDEYPMDLTSPGSIEYTDREPVPPDTSKDYFYKLEAFSTTSKLLKSYLPIFIPRFELKKGR
jgi:hypothetical protein